MNRAERTAAVAIAASILLGIYLVSVAAITHSRGVWAGAALVGIRLLTSVMLLAGLKLSERHSDTFPLGLYKLQNLISMLLGAFVILLSYELVKGNIWKLYVGHGAPHGGFVAFSCLAAAIVVSGFFAWYKSLVGREESCPALTADARNSLADFLMFSAVALSILLEMSGVRHIHTVITLIVGFYLFYVGGRVLLDGLKVLLDASVDRTVLRDVGRIAEGHPLVESVVDVKGRNSGGYRFINLSILVVTTDLRMASKVALDIESQVRQAVPHVDRVRVEFDVKPKKSLLCAVPAEGEGVDLSRGFAEAGSLELFEVDLDKGSIASSERFENPVSIQAAGRGVRLAVALARRGVDAVLSRVPIEDEDTLGTLEAYEITVLERPGAETLAAAEAELRAFAVELGGEGDGRWGGDGL